MPTLSPRLRPLTIAAPLLALLAGGCDDPSCLFSGTCTQGGVPGGPGGPVGGLGSVSATFPPEGAFMAPGAPEVEASFPGTGGAVIDAHPQMPYFVQFTESMDPSSFRPNSFDLINSLTGQTVPLFTPALVGNGRVAVIQPVAPLPENQSFVLSFSAMQQISDLNGQLLNVPMGQATIGQFTVNSAATTGPIVRFAYPNDGEMMTTDGVEVVIGFDRPMDAATFTAQSFEVTVDGGDPAIDPDPVALVNDDVPGGFPQTQVWRWRPLDGNGRPQTYGTNANVQVLMSPTGARILSEEGDELVTTETDFFTVGFTLPQQVAKPVGATPKNAFGQVEINDPGAVLFEIDLVEPAPSNLFADVFLFGSSPTSSGAVRSLVRTVGFPEATATLGVTTADLDLFTNSGDLQFADGPFSIAVQLRRNQVRSGARLFDGDRDTDVLEGAVFDTTPPTLLGLGADPDSAVVDRITTDLGGLTIVGRADEEVAFAHVRVDGGATTNGGTVAEPPPTAWTGTDPGTGDGYFIAQAVDVGVTDPDGAPRDFELFLYDRAGNASSAGISGTFGQVGVVGPGGAPTGQPVSVRVLDARTYAPVDGALVFTHSEQGGAVNLVDSDATGADGRVTVDGAGVGATVLTVDRAGYDLFTFHGVPRDRIDVLLERVTASANGADADVSGTVSAAVTTSGFSMAKRVVADTRFARSSRFGDTSPFTINPQTATFEAPYGPFGIAPERLGLTTFFATVDDLPLVGFAALTYLQGFAISGPLAPVAAGETATGVDLDAGGALIFGPSAEQPVAVAPHALDATSIPGMPDPNDAPIISVEAAATGVAGPLVLGRGIPYEVAMDQYSVLSAIAGVAAPGGSLDRGGSIDPDLFLRAELQDGSGNVAIARPRLSTSGNTLDPLGVPLVLSPAPGGMVAGAGFNAVVTDVVTDASGLEGVTRLRLEDGAGRGWVAYRLDTSDAAGDLVISFPDIAAAGGAGLTPGSIEAAAITWAGPFDRSGFLYTELERESVGEGRAAPITFTLP